MSQQDRTSSVSEKLWGSPARGADVPMPADDLADLAPEGFQYELVRGVLIRMPPPQDEQGAIQVNLATAIKLYCKVHQNAGRVRVETGYLLSAAGEPDTVLGPEVSYIAPGRQGERTGAYERITPDLVVEIASPSQYRPEMIKKAQIYLAAGTRMVWVIWPNSQTIEIWRQPTGGKLPSAILTPEDALEGDDVLPGFHCPARDLFESE